MSEKEEKTFGNRVKEIRKRLKLNQEELGKEIGVTLQHISAIERNGTKPGYKFFFNLVKKFNVNLKYLMFNEGEMFQGEEKKGEISTGEIKTGNPETDEFLYYFFNSELVKYHLMHDFKKLMGEEGDSIKRLMKSPGNKK